MIENIKIRNKSHKIRDEMEREQEYYTWQTDQATNLSRKKEENISTISCMVCIASVADLPYLNQC